MSFSVGRTVFSATGKLLRTGAKCGSVIGQANSSVYSGLSAQTSRTLTRSLWHMCRTDNTHARTAFISKTCSCRCIHTTGDKELSDFLTEEIGLEKKSEKTPAGSVKGFQVVSSTGADVVLQKKHENETISIKLNVNGTVDDEINVQDEHPEEAGDAKMVSRPPFIVELNKGGDTTLSLQCSFPHPDDAISTNPDDQQQYEDLIEIQEVALLKGGEKWEDGTYCVQGSILDGNLYDMLLNMLEERGIDGQFVDQLVEFSTTYEHKKYVGFLEGLKEFANKS